MAENQFLKITESDLKGDCYRLNRNFELTGQLIESTTNTVVQVSSSGTSPGGGGGGSSTAVIRVAY